MTTRQSVFDSRILRFSATGAVGFVVDASLLTLLVNGLGWGHVGGRVVSFAAAATITWWINRNHVFSATSNKSTEYSRYVAVQTTGAVINLAVYFIAIQIWPALARWPVVPLAMGAVVALLFNFLACRQFVFGANSGKVQRYTAGSVAEYSGTDNLESMEMAHNYNAYLCSEVRKYLRGQRVFDFGAGTGTFARLLADGSIKLTCIEPDESLRKRLQNDGFDVAADISVTAQPAEFIYTLNVLEHIEDDSAALRQIHSHIQKDGTLFIYVPAFESLYGSMDLKVGHFRRYRMNELLHKLRDSGFEITEARYVDSLGFIAAWAFKHLGNNDGNVSASSVAIYDRFIFPLSRVLDYLCGRFFGKNLLVVATPRGTNS